MKKILMICLPYALILALVLAVFGDSWALPEPKKYFSANKEHYVEVIPKKLESQWEYFQDKVNKKDSHVSKKGDEDNYCKGILYGRAKNGTYQKVWSAPLSNEVAPVSAFVSNDGQYVITFDNWHMVGYGDNVVVIYGKEGKQINKLSLKDIFTDEEIIKLPHSISSIYWGGEHHIDESNGLLVLRVVSRWSGSFNDEPEWKDVKVELRSGKILRKAPTA
jgi:hypothetical protein